MPHIGHSYGHTFYICKTYIYAYMRTQRIGIATSKRPRSIHCLFWSVFSFLTSFIYIILTYASVFFRTFTSPPPQQAWSASVNLFEIQNLRKSLQNIYLSRSANPSVCAELPPAPHPDQPAPAQAHRQQEHHHFHRSVTYTYIYMYVHS